MRGMIQYVMTERGRIEMIPAMEGNDALDENSKHHIKNGISAFEVVDNGRT